MNCWKKPASVAAVSTTLSVASKNCLLELLFDDTVTDTAADRQKKGCFLVNTSAELAIHEENVVNITTRGMNEFEAFFRRCIEVGQMRGQLKSALQPETTARVLLALICGIRTLGRGLFDEKELQVIADDAKQLVF